MACILFVTVRCRCNAGDAFVESSTGSGFVHIAPGHGLEDYQLGKQVGLADLFAREWMMLSLSLQRTAGGETNARPNY